MSKDIIYFAEDVCGLKLPKWQKEMLLQLYETYKKGGHFVINVYRHQGKQLLQNILINYELWSKNQRIAELEEQLKNAIVPKFNRQEHICSFAFGEIREYIVVAYLDNNITLCENIEDNTLEWCDNNFLERTFEEAQAKLKELGEKK